MIEIQRALKQENIDREKLKKQQILVGIGINVGEAVVGNIGSQDRLDYTVIGDSVNIASRLQDLAEGEEILVSEAVFEALKKIPASSLNVKFSYPMPVKVKGKAETINIYKIIL